MLGRSASATAGVSCALTAPAAAAAIAVHLCLVKLMTAQITRRDIGAGIQLPAALTVVRRGYPYGLGGASPSSRLTSSHVSSSPSRTRVNAYPPCNLSPFRRIDRWPRPRQGVISCSVRLAYVP